MNTKILLSSCLAAMLAFSAGAYAEDAPSEVAPDAVPHHQFDGPKMHEMHQKKLAEELGLSEEQLQKAEELRKADFEKMKPLIEEMKALREKMNNMRKENLEAFKEILTPEQKAKFEAIVAEHRAKMQNMPRGHHFGKRPEMDKRSAPVAE